MSQAVTSFTKPTLLPCTLVFLIREKQVLLGLKKKGVGQGKYVGIGGKIEHGELPEAAAMRELQEETTITSNQLEQVGTFEFLFPHKPEWSEKVQVYVCRSWEGEPQETIEIKPAWFDTRALPLSQMWGDAYFWLPAVLDGYKVSGSFIFSSDLKVRSVNLRCT